MSLSNSTFVNNKLDGHLLSLYINTTQHAIVEIDRCMFFSNIKAKHVRLASNYFGNVKCIVKNVTFFDLRNIHVILTLRKVQLSFKGYIKFRNIQSQQILIGIKNSSFTLDGYIEFYSINATLLVSSDQIQLQRNTLLAFNVQKPFLATKWRHDTFSPLYPPCLFQYWNLNVKMSSYSILLKDIYIPKFCAKHFRICVSHCSIHGSSKITDLLNSWQIN